MGVLKIMSKLETEKQKLNLVYIMHLLCCRKRYGRFIHKNIFKIGVTSNLTQRLHGLESSGCPFTELELIFWVRFNNKISCKEAEESILFKYQESNIKRREWFWFQSAKAIPSYVKKYILYLPGAIEISEYLPKYTEVKKDRYFIKESVRNIHHYHKQKDKAKCAICNKEFIKGSWQAKYCSHKCRKVVRDKYFDLQKQLIMSKE